MLPPDFKTTVLDRVNIVDLIGQEISLKRSGTTYSCLCPFHNDKNPSMHIWEETQTFKCFACGMGGDAISFTIEYFKLPYLDALKELAKRYGIPIPEISGTVEKSNATEIFRLNAIALDIYKKNFFTLPNEGYAYMVARDFTRETLEEFNIGFAPSADANFQEFLLKEDSHLLDLAGLIKVKENGASHPTFFSRVMFPIEDERGRVLGFGGRTLNPQEKAFKYINTSETEVFHKRKMLFGIKQALEEMKKKKSVIITEGYTDVMMMHQHGYKNAVAVLGTALGADHIRLIKRFCKEAILLLDGDEAGRNAMMRSMETFLSEDFLVSIAVLPNGQDPFDALRAQQGVHFQESLDARMSVTDFLLGEFKRKYQLNTVAGKTEASSELVKLFAVVKNPVKLSTLITEFSEKLGVDELSLRKHFSILQEKKQKFNSHRAMLVDNVIAEVKDFYPENYGTAVERLMLTLALKEESFLNELAGLGVVEYITNENIAKVLNLLLASEPQTDFEKLFRENLTTEEMHLVNHLKYATLNTKSIHLVKEFERLKLEKKQDQKTRIQKELKLADEAKDNSRKNELLLELARLK